MRERDSFETRSSTFQTTIIECVNVLYTEYFALALTAHRDNCCECHSKQAQ